MSRIVNRILGGDDDDDDDDEQNVIFLGDPPRLNATATPTENGGEDNVVMIVRRATKPKDQAAERKEERELMKGNVTQHKREGFQGDFLPKKGEEKKCWDILRTQPLRAERSLHRVTSERHARLCCLFVKSFSFFFFFLSCFSKLFSC